MLKERNQSLKWFSRLEKHFQRLVQQYLTKMYVSIKM